MATEFLVPNGDDAGWTDGSYLEVDNGGIAPGSPGAGPSDGVFVLSSTSEGQVINLDLSDSAVLDADTVTAIDVYVRARTTSGNNDSVAVDLLIGGVAQGTQYDTGALGATFVNYTISGSTQGWNADRTAAQMDGMQIRLTSAQAGMPGTVGIEVSEVEVLVTYTEAATGITAAVVAHHRRMMSR